MFGVLLAKLRLDIVPQDGESLAAQRANLFYFIVQQSYLSLVGVSYVESRRNAIEESDLVFLTGVDELLNISALFFCVQFSPHGPVLGVILRSVPFFYVRIRILCANKGKVSIFSSNLSLVLIPC